MHEASLMADLVRKITALAEQQGAERVARVSVRLGALSSMSTDHFRAHFAQAAAGTPAEGAIIEVLASDDLADENAQSIVLRSIDVESRAG